MNQRLQLLRQGIERRTQRENFTPHQKLVGLSSDATLIEDCLDDLFLSEEQRVLVLSFNELLSLAQLGLDRSRIALKSLSQLSLLSGGAAGIFILAIGTLERAAWTLAGLGGTFAIISSLVSLFVARRAHRRARSFAELVQKLPRN
jgi:hypothetical protein